MTDIKSECCAERLIHPDNVNKALDTLIDGPTSLNLANLFSALSDPTRLRILSALRSGELCVCDLSSTLGMTQSAVSHQLRILRNLAIVKNRKSGRVVYYSLDDEHIADLFARGLEHAEHSQEHHRNG